MIKKKKHYGYVNKASLRIQHQGSKKRTVEECSNKFQRMFNQFEGWEVETNQANAILACNMIKATRENYRYCWSDFKETYPEMCESIDEKERELKRLVDVVNAGI